MLVNFAHDSILIYDKNGVPLFGSPNMIGHNLYPNWVGNNCKNLEELENNLGIKSPHFFDEQIDKNLFDNASMALNMFNINYMFDNTNNNLKINSVDYFYKNKTNFIYPISYFHPYYIENRFDTIDLPENLVKSLSEGIGVVGFFQPTEGSFGETNKSYIWMCELSKKYNLKKEQLLIVTSNLRAKERYKELIKDGVVEDKITIYTYDYFANSIWFNNNGCFKLNKDSNQQMWDNFNNSITNNKIEKKLKHFLCLNRITRPHRMIIFAELMSNPKLIGKSYVSLGKSSHNPSTKEDFYNITNGFLGDDYKHGKDRLLGFYKNYDSTEHFVFDENDLENNKAEVLNLDAQNKSFVNIVTETLIDNNTIFFSEKIYKPIYCAQPFILIGNSSSLRKLREKGYKTFNKWWDESYDDELNFTRKFEKIMDVIDEISTWSLEKCFEVTQEMEETLRHNFNVMMSSDETNNFYKFLTTEKTKRKLI
jgi:hypothetical protein